MAPLRVQERPLKDKAPGRFAPKVLIAAISASRKRPSSQHSPRRSAIGDRREHDAGGSGKPLALCDIDRAIFVPASTLGSRTYRGAGSVLDRRPASRHLAAQTARTATIFTIFEGTSEIQRMIIGRAVTGLEVR